MYRKLAEINADIRTTVAAIEAEGNDERITMTAKFFTSLDLKYSADTLGLDQAPKISAAIAQLPEEGHYPADNRRWHRGEHGSLTQKLASLLGEKDNAVEHYTRESLRPRTPLDLLKDALQEAEQSGSNMEVDEIAFLLNSFVDIRWSDLVGDKPRIKAKLADMAEETRSERQAFLACSARRKDDDIVGRVADLIIRWQHR